MINNKFQTLSSNSDDDSSAKIESISQEKNEGLTKSSFQNSFMKVKPLLIVFCLILLIIVLFTINRHEKEPVIFEAPIPTTTSHVAQTFSLQALCNETFWKPQLFLNCTKLAGGTFNVRSAVVTCIRWAIDSGMGIIMPIVWVRSDTNLGDYFHTWKNLSHLFDTAHLLETLSRDCPSLVIKDTFSTEFTNRIVAETLQWKQYSTGQIRSHIYDLLVSNNIDTKVPQPTVIVEDNPLFGWEWNRDRNMIHMALINAVQFNPEILNLARSLMTMMPSRFVGLHLRCEKDFPWYNYESIVKWFKQIFLKSYPDIDVVYIAVGDQDIEQRFREEMNELSVQTISKWSLASDNIGLTDKMRDLKFDQLAIVDYEILKSSSYLFGVGQSSYSYGIALERGNGNITNSNSHLYGRLDRYFECCY